MRNTVKFSDGIGPNVPLSRWAVVRLEVVTVVCLIGVIGVHALVQNYAATKKHTPVNTGIVTPAFERGR